MINLFIDGEYVFGICFFNSYYHYASLNELVFQNLRKMVPMLDLLELSYGCLTRGLAS